MNTKIIILAAGQGKRMQHDGPKVLAEVNGRPMIDHVISAAAEVVGYDNIIVAVGYQAEKVEAMLPAGVTSVMTETLGTGYATKQCLPAAADADQIVVLYGDMPLISVATIKSLIETRKESDAKLVMAITQPEDFLDWRIGFEKFGRIIRDDQGSIDRVVEHADATDEERSITELNPSFFCADKNWLVNALDKVTNDNAQGEYYLTDIIGLARQGGEVIAAVSVDPREAMGANTKDQLQVLGDLM